MAVKNKLQPCRKQLFQARRNPTARVLQVSGLEIRRLNKRFGNIVALDGVSLKVGRGELIGFLGPNGAGKTTTMRSVVGLSKPDSGEILWDGKPITEHDRKRIGYMPQERGLYPRMKVHEHVHYMGKICGLDSKTASRRADEWCERVGLKERRDDLIQELSTGNQQRVQLAVALVHEPQLLLLDEPFAGLDPVAVAMLSDIMHDQTKQGTSVLFSSHQLELVQDLAENVVIVAEGRRVASGNVLELRHSSPQRTLEIIWAHPAPDWVPLHAHRLAAKPMISRFAMGATVDPAEVISEATTHGTISSVSFEAPNLEEVFLEKVTGTTGEEAR